MTSRPWIRGGYGGTPTWQDLQISVLFLTQYFAHSIKFSNLITLFKI